MLLKILLAKIKLFYPCNPFYDFTTFKGSPPEVPNKIYSVINLALKTPGMEPSFS